MRESKEASYPGSMIIVETNQPVVEDVAGAESLLEQSIKRYWYDSENDELASEEIFAF